MGEITLEARTENLDQAIAFVDGLLEERQCPVKAQRQIDIAVEELFVNIANYAYGGTAGTATIQVSLQEEPPAAVITFMDNGVPYDPLARKDPDVTLPAEQRQAGGLGIFIVKKIMDDISYEYRDGKNILCIKKNI